MRTIPYAEARDTLAALMDEVAADRVPVKITRRRGGNVVLMSARTWAGLNETLHLMAFPANAAHLLEGIRQLDAGFGVERALIER